MDNKSVLLAENKEPVISKLTIAEDWLSRAKGLLFRSSIDEDEGLLIPRCNAIHTFGMRFPIDVIFFTDDGIVESIHQGVESGHVAICRGAKTHVLEAKAGFIERNKLKQGDHIRIE